ncbi:hypothetical protein ACHAWC_000634 [Mediolabrus comicus]
MVGCVSLMCNLKHDAVTPFRSLLVEHAKHASGACSGNVSVALTTRELISSLSSRVSSPILILARIFPNSGSSLNLWLLSRKIAQLMVFSQTEAAGEPE